MGLLNFIATTGSLLIGGGGGAAAGAAWAIQHSKAINMAVGVVEIAMYAMGGAVVGAGTLSLVVAALL